MKRVYLWEPGKPVIHLPTVRAAAVSLANFAVNGSEGRSVGDDIFEWVTECRMSEYEYARDNGKTWAKKMYPYSSCGDLAHWMLTMLGCRDETVINRTDDGGLKNWEPGPNISRLVGSKYYVKGHNVSPLEGDIIHVSSPHHVAVVTWVVSDDQWVTADYGQPYGQQRVNVVRRTCKITYVRGRPLQGIVSLKKMVELDAFTESAVVPDGFELGVPDDNPYSEYNTIHAMHEDWVLK